MMISIIIKLFYLLSFISASVVGDESFSEQVKGYVDPASEYYKRVTTLESVFPGCEAGGVRQYFRQSIDGSCKELISEFEAYNAEESSENLDTLIKNVYAGCLSETSSIEVCIKGLAKEVKSVKSLFNELNAISEKCEVETIAIDTNHVLENIYQNSEEKTVVKLKLASENATTSASPDLQVFDVKFVDSEIYNTTCATEDNGVYREISYAAVCEEINSATKETIKKVFMFVFDHPRCYAKSCAASDDPGLLQEFTLRLTEELNEVKANNLFWLCVGKEGPEIKEIELLIPLKTPAERIEMIKEITDALPIYSFPSETATPNTEDDGSPTSGPTTTTPKPVSTPSVDRTINIESGSFFGKAGDVYRDNQIIVRAVGATLGLILLGCICCICSHRGDNKVLFDDDEDEDYSSDEDF